MKRKMGCFLLAALVSASPVFGSMPAAESEIVEFEPAQTVTEAGGEEETAENAAENSGESGKNAGNSGENSIESGENSIESGENSIESEENSGGTSIDVEETQDSFENEEFPDDYEFVLFTEENAGLLQTEGADDPLIEGIEEGEMIALAPVLNTALTSAATVSALSDEGISLAAETSKFTMTRGDYLNMDEVWIYDGNHSTHLGTSYREIKYTDDEGVSHKAPVYCLNASKKGPMTPSMTLKDEAIKALTNSSIRKILYYGYGGPADICDTYDPTCSHCDWSKMANRYVLTHNALSKIYSGDVGGATAAECEHVGLNRWITKLTSLAIPNVKDVKFSGKDINGDTVSVKDMKGNLTYYRNVPDSLNWSGMTKGIQISSVYSLMASQGKNGIKFTRGSTDTWVMGYWTSSSDYSERGLSNPRVLAKGKSVTLYKGARIRFAFPYNMTASKKFSYTAVLKPVQYICINGDIQMNGSDYQNLGTYYYEGARETLSLTFVPSPSGTVVLEKSADHDPDEKIEGAGYQLRAAENIVSNGVTIYKKDERVTGGYTDENGKLTFLYIPTGNYYLMETSIKSGTEAENYLLDSAKHPVTVKQNATVSVSVSEIPDSYGKVSIKKVIADTELILSDAVFTLYSWSKNSNSYTNGVNLSYNASLKRYESDIIRYTSDNQGKFLVRETQNPSGFTGIFSREFSLSKMGQEELFEFTAENEVSPRRIELVKLDSVTKNNLSDAEFTVYSWDNAVGAYESIGTLLTYDAATGRYYSEILDITDKNTGRYKIVETRVPEGYTGSFQQEINLMEENPKLQFTVENTPVVYPKGRIKIRKTASETGTILKDAEFTVYQYQKNTGKYENTLGDRAKIVYDENSGLYCSKDLSITPQNEGKFKVVETKAPSGYIGSWEKEFVLTESRPEPDIFEAVNEPDRPPLGEISVIKKIKENEIIWAHGDPVFRFIVEGTDTKGNVRKYENYICFSQDGYTVDENGYATLEITFKNIPAGSYRVSEKQVLYYYLENVIANTSNVTVTKNASPSYGTLPVKIAYGNVTLTAVNNRASLTFINRKARYDRYLHNDVLKNTIPLS